MPVALPGGYVDTALTKSLPITATVKLRSSHGWRPEGATGVPGNPGYPNNGNIGDTININEWILYSNPWGGFCFLGGGGPPTPGYQGTYELWVHNTNGPIPGGAPDVLVDTFSFACRPQFPAGSQPSHTFTGTFSEVTGPWRLGVLMETIDPDPENPSLWPNYKFTYKWFGDENTTKVSTFCGVTVTFYVQPSGTYWGPTQHVGMTPREAINGIGALDVSGTVANLDGTGDVDVIEINSVIDDTWALDYSEVPSTVAGNILQPNGAASLKNVIAGSTPYHLRNVAPYRLAYDLDIRKFNTTADPTGSTRAHIGELWLRTVQLHSDGTQKTPQISILTCPVDPASFHYIVPWTSWETHKKKFTSDDDSRILPLQLDIDGDWAATNPDIPLEGDDLRVPIWAAPALKDPTKSNQSYAPASVAIINPLDLEFPDGARASHWTINNGAYGSVVEGGASTTFHVLDTRAVFTRTLAGSGGGAGLWKDAVSHSGDAYEWTKHNHFSSPEDVWCWDSYGFIRYNINANAVCNPSLLVVGNYLSVTDPHLTDGSGYSSSLIAFTYSYDFLLGSGGNLKWLDLLFPASGGPGPVYPSRVDRLQLSGFAVGDYILSEFTLRCRYSSQSYKVDFGPPNLRLTDHSTDAKIDYSVFHGANDGAFAWGNWPDQAYKPDEIGSYGGAARYCQILTGAVSGLILDTQYDIAGFLAHINRAEGWSVTYSSGAFDAANRDTFGNALSPENADWIHPVVPGASLTPNVADTPPCSPVVRALFLANSFPDMTFSKQFILYTRWPIWGALEALAKLSGGRAPAGIVFEAYRTDTGATVVDATTDAAGYLVATPLPANSSRAYDLRPA